MANITLSTCAHVVRLSLCSVRTINGAVVQQVVCHPVAQLVVSGDVDVVVLVLAEQTASSSVTTLTTLVSVVADLWRQAVL